MSLSSRRWGRADANNMPAHGVEDDRSPAVMRETGHMNPRPVLVVVDDDPEALKRTHDELERRYGRDYRIWGCGSPATAIAELEELRSADEEVALVLADVWMAEQGGPEVLERVRSLHPYAKRALTIDWGAWGDRPTADALLHAMAAGRVDFYALKPAGPGDEQFHRFVAELLHEWSRERSPVARELTIVADPSEPRTHELRDLMRRSGVSYGFQPAAGAAPTLRMRDGRTLRDPTNEEIVAAFGVDTEQVDDTAWDLVVVGAGPAGLSAAVYASSEGLRTLVVERETIGGQAGSSSLIRNYLGFARGVTGSELAQRAYQQAWVFGVRFAISREAQALHVGSHPYELVCDGGFTARASAVLLATGASYRRLEIAGLEHLTGAGVYYGASTVEGLGLGGGDVYVIGGGNSAGQAALHLARTAARVRLLVRGRTLAESMSEYLRTTIDATGNVEVLIETEVVDGGGDGRLEWLELRDGRGERTTVEAAALFVLIGAKPLTAWLAEAVAMHPSGHVLTGQEALAAAGAAWPLERPPTTYETSVPGVFAVGDTRWGAIKRVASAVGEGSVAIPDVHRWLETAPAV
jgi:thioredoxin reductase (NADPH)